MYEGAVVREADGSGVGTSLGCGVGLPGSNDGANEGEFVGRGLGTSDGKGVGTSGR